MNREGRPPNYTQDEFDEIWRLYRSGYNLRDISQTMGINPGSIHVILHRYGGIAPYGRKPRRDRLTLEDREEISRGESMRTIAKRVRRPVSTVSRGVGRNGDAGSYRASSAHKQALVRLKRPKLDINEKLHEHVVEKLELDWSPEQIAGELPLSFPDDVRMRISHETIYKTIFIQARGSLEKGLRVHLRSKRKIRKSRNDTPEEPRQGRIMDAISIRERPAEAEDRAIPGHWEGDRLRYDRFGSRDPRGADEPFSHARLS